MMLRPSLDTYWLAMLPLIASRATCPRRAVGAILTDKDGRIVSTGYNGTVSSAVHCLDTPCPGSPALGGRREACEATHAELNAVLQATSSRRQPFTAYCSITPCRPCAQALLGTGIKEVVAAELYKHEDTGPKLLNKAGVLVWVWRNNERTPWASEDIG